MKRQFVWLLVILAAVSMLTAQERAGNIYGKVVDDKGEGLPGVSVTLTGSLTAPVSVSSGADGSFKFLSLPPAKDYALKAALQGFKTKNQTAILINIGANIHLTLIMEIGNIEQEVTVVAKNPVIDLKRTGVAASFTEETMQTLSNGRDTRSIMSLVPGEIPTQTALGEVRQGTMANNTARGSVMASYWGQVAIDGQRIDPRYFDQDAYEEVQVTVGGANIKSRSGDTNLNMVTKRGGNTFALGGRFYVLDEKFQASNLTQSLKSQGVTGTDRVILNKDYGFNFGGPIVKDKAWFWFSYGVKDSDEVNITGYRTPNIQTTYNAKLNFQLLPENRLEIWGMSNQMHWVGRGASATVPLGIDQVNPYHFGAPFFHLQDEHMFGDKLFMAANLFLDDGGYNLRPIGNPGNGLMGIYDQGNVIWQRYTYDTSFNNPRINVDLQGTYFNDTLFGVSHEMKAAVEFEKVGIQGISDDDIAQRTNVVQNINYTTKTIDITGDNLPDVVPSLSRLVIRRWGEKDYYRSIFGAYFTDTITAGAFNVILGFRYDRAWYNINGTQVVSAIDRYRDTLTDFTPAAKDAIVKIIPSFNMPGLSPDYRLAFFSPRLALVWDVGKKGTTTVKLSLGQYPYRGDLQNIFKASEFNPLGELARLDFFWLDDNKNKYIEHQELYWSNSKTSAPYRAFDDAGNFVGDWTDGQSIFWDAYDPLNPTKLTNPLKTISKDAIYGRSREISLSFEHELIRDLKVGVNLIHKVYDKLDWVLKYWPDAGKKESSADYVQVGTLPAKIGTYDLGAAAGKPYYLYSKDYVPTIYTFETVRPDYTQKYYGIDFIFEKRMSSNWMLNGSVTFQSFTQNFGGAAGYLDPTNNWALDGRPYANNQPRWMVKLNGVYRLPFGFNVGATLFAREGFNLRESVTVTDLNAPNSKARTVLAYIGNYGDLRLKPWIYLAVHLEKMISMGDKGKFYIMLDFFNVPNLATVTTQQNRDIGTYYPNDGSFVPNPRVNQPTQILDPRMLRLGIKFQI